MTSRYQFKQSLTLYLSRNTIRLAIAISAFCLLFIAGLAKADLNTAPPKVSLLEQQKKTQIQRFIAKADDAINKKFLTRPVGINAVYYVEQLLLLSPDDKRAMELLTKVCDVYTAMAYRRLEEKKVKLAQRHHNRAMKIALQFNLDFYYPKMANLRREIAIHRNNIIQINAEQKKSTETSMFSSKIEQQSQKKPVLVVEEQLPRPEMQALSRKTSNSLTKQDNITGDPQKNMLSVVERMRIVVIVNKRNNVSSLTLNELKSLYKGQKKTWPNGKKVTLYLPPVGSDAHLWLTKHVFLKNSFIAVTQFYMRGLNRYQFITMPATSTNSVSDVSHVIGGIAIVQVGETEGHESIKIISIKGT